ncbi:MAG: GtrA family protein [Patescibacteria group bacterium]
MPKFSKLISLVKDISLYKFAVVGVCNTMIDIGFYTLLTRGTSYFGDHILLAKTISFILATIFSFLVNKYWTFGHRNKVKMMEVLKFYSTALIGIFINVGSLYIFHIQLGWYDLLAVLAATGASFVWNFSFSRFWVFKKQDNEQPDELH